MTSRVFDPDSVELADILDEERDEDVELPANVLELKPTDAWRTGLMIQKGGSYRPTLQNACTFLRNLPETQELFCYDLLHGQPTVTREASWVYAQPGEPLRSVDATRTADWLGRKEWVAFSQSTLEAAILAVAHDKTIDPIRKYLTSLPPAGHFLRGNLSRL